MLNHLKPRMDTVSLCPLAKMLYLYIMFLSFTFTFKIYAFLDDIFGIDEITLFDGEWEEKNYSVAGEILDGVSWLLIEMILIHSMYAVLTF